MLEEMLSVLGKFPNIWKPGESFSFSIDRTGTVHIRSSLPPVLFNPPARKPVKPLTAIRKDLEAIEMDLLEELDF